MLKPDLIGFESRQPPQLHLQDRVGLDLAEPKALHQLQSGAGRVGGTTDQSDDRVEIVEGDQQAEQDVITLLGLAQQVPGAPLDRLDAELEEHLEHFAQGEQLGLALDQGQHVGAEVALQRRELEQVVQHHLRVGIPPQFNHDAHAVAIRFIADIGDTLQFLVIHQFGNALDQRRLVGLVGQLGDDHRIPVRAPLGLRWESPARG